MQVDEILKKNAKKLAEISVHNVVVSGKHHEKILARKQEEFEALLTFTHEEEDSVHLAVGLLNDLGFQLFDEDSATLMEELQKKIKEKQVSKKDNISLRDLLGIKQDKIEGLYELASILCEGHLYTQARDIFLFAINLDPYFTNCWLGLAYSLECLHQYDRASKLYETITLLDKNPDIYIKAINCLIKSHNIIDARKLLTQTEHLVCSIDQQTTLDKLRSKIH